MTDNFDVLIIGAGAVGCAAARELSRFRLTVAVLEKEADVAAGTSGRNSAVVHAGFNNRPGSQMAKLCVEGNRRFEALCRELDVPYKKTGKLLTAFDRQDLAILEGLQEQGRQNGCQGLRMLDEQELHVMLPGVGGIGAMLSPNTAVFDPFLYTVALAENAQSNGVSFFLNREVTAIEKRENFFWVSTPSEQFTTRILINCAGLSCGKISEMAGGPAYFIYPCRGEYLILDRIADRLLPLPVYPAPRKGAGGLGVHLTPTIHGNIIIGPNAEYIDDADDCATTKPTLDFLFSQAQQLLPGLQRRDIIGSYSGIRSKQSPPDEGIFRDFIIQEEASCPGLINLIGIESPGMTASVPIAERVASMVTKQIPAEPNPTFDPHHTGILRFAEQTPERKAQLIAEDPDYGEVVCRCQQITRKEIRQAIENPLGARTVAAVKYRAWATTGRCQGGYCLTRIVDMMEHEYGIPPEEITLRGTGSELFSGRVKP